jgi:hypothetical protein
METCSVIIGQDILTVNPGQSVKRGYFSGLRSICERKLVLLSGGLFFGGLEILRGNPGLSPQWRLVSRPKHSARKPWIVS